MSRLPLELKEAKNLLRSLLDVDPKMRLSALGALNHPFLYEGDNDEGQVLNKLDGECSDEGIREYIIKRMRNFWEWFFTLYCLLYLISHYYISKSNWQNGL